MTRAQGLVAALAVLTAGCHTPADAAAAGDVTPLAGGLAALPIAPEDTSAHYNRRDWPHWREQGDGCDTRQLVLRQQGHAVRVGANCTIIAGEWDSAYDGVIVTDPTELDIDHVVPLAEVARSGRIVNGHRVGPRIWSRDQRAAYANDPRVLVAVTATSNRSKGDDDPGRWLPSHDRCHYVTWWIEIKTRYELSVDQTEHDALASVLTACGDVTPHSGGGHR